MSEKTEEVGGTSIHYHKHGCCGFNAYGDSLESLRANLSILIKEAMKYAGMPVAVDIKPVAVAEDDPYEVEIPEKAIPCPPHIAEAAEEKKARKPRKSKKQPATDEQVDDESAKAAEVATTPPEDGKLTVDMVREKVAKVVKEKGLDVAKNMLKAYGAASVTALTPDKFQLVFDTCGELLGE